MRDEKVHKLLPEQFQFDEEGNLLMNEDQIVDLSLQGSSQVVPPEMGIRATITVSG